MTEFLMPSLGADMEFGRVVAWHVCPGDRVTRGDVVAEVDTEKAVIDVEIFVSGTVEEILVPVGERVPVGTPLAVIADGIAATGPSVAAHAPPTDEAPPTGEAPTPGEEATPVETPIHGEAPTRRKEVTADEVRTTAGAASSGEAPTVDQARVTGAAASVAGRSRVPASPVARRHAARLGVDLADVRGTGPGGAVTTSDVERHAATRAGAPSRVTEGTGLAVAPATAEPATAEPAAEPAAVEPAPVGPATGAERRAGMRRAIAASMSRANREIPQYHLASDVDLSSALRWLDRRNAAVAVTDRVLPAAVLLKATALALRSAPALNGTYEDGAFRPSEAVHLGVAVAVRGGGLTAPAIRDADSLELGELMARLRDLVARVRSGGLRASEMSDATITVTNLGDQGVDSVLPVIYPPQVAIVGFGRIRPRPWAVEDAVAVRPVVTTTLAADHRVSDGHVGAVFLRAVDTLLQKPEEL